MLIDLLLFFSVDVVITLMTIRWWLLSTHKIQYYFRNLHPYYLVACGNVDDANGKHIHIHIIILNHIYTYVRCTWKIGLLVGISNVKV